MRFICLAFLSLTLCRVTLAADLHVAPNGNDDHDGSAGAPFRSLDKARGAARSLRKANPDAAINIFLHPGTHTILKTVAFGPEDAGTDAAPLNIRNWHDPANPDARPVLVGGAIVGGCDIWHIGGHGVSLSGGDPVKMEHCGHAVENCYIHHVGQFNRHGIGVMLHGGAGIRYNHCTDSIGFDNHGKFFVFANNAGPQGQTCQLSLQTWNNSPEGLFLRDRQPNMLKEHERLMANPAWAAMRGMHVSPADPFLPDGTIMRGNVITRNIFYYPAQPDSRYIRENGVNLQSNTINSNIVWNGGAAPVKTGRQAFKSAIADPTAKDDNATEWDAWQMAGADTHSIVADPLFVDPANACLGSGLRQQPVCGTCKQRQKKKYGRCVFFLYTKLFFCFYLFNL